MGLFWKRKSGDQFVSLKLNEPSPAPSVAVEERTVAVAPETKPPVSDSVSAPVRAAAVEPVPTGGGPTPVPIETSSRESLANEARAKPRPQQASPGGPQQKPVPSRSPFATSVLGLNLSMEELQAQEAALEQEFSARFRRAVSATRESLSERLDTVFQGLKQIDENLLDELEEALIAADIGVATTQHILETVRRGIARKQINDLDALKQAIKTELLKILRLQNARSCFGNELFRKASRLT